MYAVDLYSRVRRAYHVEGMRKSAAARLFGIDRKTVAKMLKHAVPPGYRRKVPPARPKLDPFIPIIDRILEEDRSRHQNRRGEDPRRREALAAMELLLAHARSWRPDKQVERDEQHSILEEDEDLPFFVYVLGDSILEFPGRSIVPG